MRAWCVAFPTVVRKETTKEPTREHTTNKVYMQKEFVVLGTRVGSRECKRCSRSSARYFDIRGGRFNTQVVTRRLRDTICWCFLVFPTRVTVVRGWSAWAGGGARKILTLALQGEGFNTQVVNLIWCFNIVLHRRDSGSFSVSQAASPAVPNEPSAVLACGAAAPEAPPNSQIVRDLE